MGSKKIPRKSGVSLQFEPRNEQEVLYYFVLLAEPHFGLQIQSIQRDFPDCEAKLGRKKLRIEFEYRSLNFKTHKHNPRGCDWIVCWIHDWPDVPNNLKVVEIRSEFGLGLEIWIVSLLSPYNDKIGKAKDGEWWTVGKTAKAGDLVLYYRAAPYSSIQDIFEVGEVDKWRGVDWKEGMEWFAQVRRIARLKKPITLSDLRNDAVLTDSGVVRRNFQGRTRITKDWPDFHRFILEKNPSVEKKLSRFVV